jgi:threonine synthase
MPLSHLSHLECSQCKRVASPDLVQTYCQDCQAPLLAIYDLVAVQSRVERGVFRQRSAGIWRWRELLPIRDEQNMLTLGEGDTPLLHAHCLGAEMGLSQLFIKEEGRNPTGSFKARGLAMAVSKAKELGIHKVIIPTAGNAGGAMAAYAARGGLRACVFMPEDTPRSNIEECDIAGAEVHLVKGLISDAARLAGEKARLEGWFDLSTFNEPYRLEGKKIMGYELAEAFEWRLPDVIIYPTGGGTGLIGMWKAFQELEDLGWLEAVSRPRMVAVQAEGCAPVVRAFHAGADSCDFWSGAHTIASGLRVPKSFADRLILKCLRESKGAAVAVSDEAIQAAQRRIATSEGVFPAPEGAATLAALEHLVKMGWVKANERIIIFNTGTGLKYL